jgi:protein-tyrosine-phosphatase
MTTHSETTHSETTHSESTRSETTRSENLLDQDEALRASLERLTHEFRIAVSPATIETFLLAAYEQFRETSRITAFLPLLAERFARQRLEAFAQVEGKVATGAPIVLFLCVHNAGRSQMAMAFFHRYAGGRAVAWSGGSQPLHAVDSAVVEAMAEKGIDLTEEFPKPWTDEIVRAADVVVTMGCGDECRRFRGKRYEDWEVEDPAGRPIEEVRRVRDEIERRVLALIDELGVPLKAR